MLVGGGVSIVQPVAFRLIAGHSELQIRVLFRNIRKPCAFVLLFFRGASQIDELPAFFNPVTDNQFLAP